MTDPYKEYIIDGELNNDDREYNWSSAIGLQKVDNLNSSEYLKDLAYKNVNGDLTLNEVKSLINTYYEEKRLDNTLSNEEEADKVSINIVSVLSTNSFTFSVEQYLKIHKDLFSDILPNAGTIRKVNITKKEWVLNEDTVIYGDADLIKDTLIYDFNEEKNFDYTGVSINDFIKHIAKFIANLWQNHVFLEGNTRTTAVFLIKYLKTFGFKVTNNIFKENSWYFRNALVRANYTNINKSIYETTEYLELFLRNLLLNENNELKNRYLHIDYKRATINKNLGLSDTLNKHYVKLYETLKNKDYFNRVDVMNELLISERESSKILSIFLDKGLIEPVKGFGKGKYRFIKK